MKHLENIKPVRGGTWLYAGSIPCEVRIVPHDTLYGTGDYEDPPEIAKAMSIAESKLGASLIWHEMD